jgi:alpha-galactosidase
MLLAIALTSIRSDPSNGQESVIRLEDLDLSLIRQSVGTAKSKQSTLGHPLKIGGRVYEHGIGTHAESYFRLGLNGKGKQFHALVGIDDDAGSFWGTGIQFWVEGDGRILAKSRPIRRRQQPQSLDADLTGVQTVTLVAAASGFGVQGDHADWIDAQITMESGTPKPLALPIEPAEILTPKPSVKPRFTGPTVLGVRPGHPIMFSVTATGQKPVTFQASKLPEWLSLDPNSGRLSGNPPSTGEFTIDLTAENFRGEATRALKLVVGEGISLTPPMGWNSWNSWGWNVTQEQVMGSAKAMASTLRDHGWTYVNIDDTWQGKRGGENNAIMPNKKFPDMKGLVDQIHSLGLLAGIYSTPWTTSYAGHIGGSADNVEGTYEWMSKADENQQTSNAGRYQHVGKFDFTDRDIKQFADWGFDYLKYDWNPIDIPHTKIAFDLMRASGRDMVFSLSNSAPFNHGDGLAAFSQLWRTSGDMSDTWGAIRANAFELAKWGKFQGPGLSLCELFGAKVCAVFGVK